MTALQRLVDAAKKMESCLMAAQIMWHEGRKHGAAMSECGIPTCADARKARHDSMAALAALHAEPGEHEQRGEPCKCCARQGCINMECACQSVVDESDSERRGEPQGSDQPLSAGAAVDGSGDK